MTSWLQKQRKGDLKELASSASLPGYEDMLKDDLVSSLDGHLRSNSSTYQANPVFSGYYERTGSPVKKERGTSAAPGDADAKLQRRRRTIKSKEDFVLPAEESSPEVTTTLATRTPRAVQRVAQRIPLPPSPQVVTDMIVRGQANVSAKINDAWEKSGTIETIESVRDVSSTVTFVQLATLLLEAWGLGRHALPWKTAIHVPVIDKLTSTSYNIVLPDFFNLLKVDFWGPTTLFMTTNLFIPILFAYFFNFTHSLKPRSRAAAGSQYRIDPLTYSVVKALTAWLVYSQGITGGLATSTTVALVNGALPGGYIGVLIGSGIGALASIYEAILTKH